MVLWRKPRVTPIGKSGSGLPPFFGTFDFFAIFDGDLCLEQSTAGAQEPCTSNTEPLFRSLYEVDSNGEATYSHFDQTGNTAALTNEGQAVIDRFRYLPYGVQIYQQGTHDTPFRCRRDKY